MNDGHSFVPPVVVVDDVVVVLEEEVEDVLELDTVEDVDDVLELEVVVVVVVPWAGCIASAIAPKSHPPGVPNERVDEDSGAVAISYCA